MVRRRPAGVAAVAAGIPRPAAQCLPPRAAGEASLQARGTGGRPRADGPVPGRVRPGGAARPPEENALRLSNAAELAGGTNRRAQGDDDAARRLLDATAVSQPAHRRTRAEAFLPTAGIHGRPAPFLDP